MKRIFSSLLILPLIFIAVFSVQAERATEHSMSEIESCLCSEIADNSVNNSCSIASVLFFPFERLNFSNEALFFDRLAFVDYQGYILSQHSTRLFRPPIAHILTL
ncbi:MAG: hypothetical protein ACJAU1_001842 [Psychromonas sp.]|jgi:hypothetical protein